MSTPKFKNTGSSYIFEWSEEKLKADISRVRYHRDGRVTCRIILTTTAGKHLWQKDGFNLSAGNNALNRKELSTRHKGEVNWTEILEQICVNSISEYERGDPMIEINAVEDIQKPPYIIKPFIVEKFPSIIFGDPSSGKTTFALFLALAMSLPWHDNPLSLPVPDKVLRVAYLDWETGKEGIEWQWKCILNGAETEGVTLYYRRCHAPLADDLDAIREYIAENKISVAIIDSLALAAGGELKDTSSPLGFYRAIGVLNIATLILAHTPKEKENRTIYGNRFFEAEARNTWEIIKQQEPGSAEMIIGLKHRKPLPWDRTMPDMAFNMSFSENGAGTIFQPGDPKTVDEIMARSTIESRIVNLLRSDGRPRTPAELSTELEKPAPEVRQVLYRVMHSKKPKLVKLGDKYALAANPDLFGNSVNNEER